MRHDWEGGLLTDSDRRRLAGEPNRQRTPGRRHRPSQAQPGGLILAHGGATFIAALIRDGLIDEYRLVIHPVAIGHGTGPFSALREPLR